MKMKWTLTFPEGVQMDIESMQLNTLGFMTETTGKTVIASLTWWEAINFRTPSGLNLAEFLKALQESGVTVE